jgi:hypothetical protein
MLDGLTARKLTGLLRACMAGNDSVQDRLAAADRLRLLERENINVLKELIL